MMSNQSKKGFRRLNTHELVEFNRNGMAGSGSESELLDLTTVDTEEPLNSCSSCCLWFSVLYVGLLTVLLLLVGIFSGYILISMWQMDQENNSTLSAVQANLTQMRKDLNSDSKNLFHVLSGLRETTFSMNNSFSTFNTSVNTTVEYLTNKIKELEHRLGNFEKQPQEFFIKQVKSIHQEMTILNRSMELMNNSFDEMKDMREQMASVGSTIKSIEGRIHDLSKKVGDTIHDNTEIQDTVQGFSDNIEKFRSRLNNMQSQMTSEHEKMQQSSDLITAQFSHLESLLMQLNSTVQEELELMWDNMTQSESVMEVLHTEMTRMENNLSSLVTKVQNMEGSTPSPTTTTTMSTSPSTDTPHTDSAPDSHSTVSTLDVAGSGSNSTQVLGTKDTSDAVSSQTTHVPTILTPSLEPTSSNSVEPQNTEVTEDLISNSIEPQNTGNTEDSPVTSNPGTENFTDQSENWTEVMNGNQTEDATNLNGNQTMDVISENVGLPIHSETPSPSDEPLTSASQLLQSLQDEMNIIDINGDDALNYDEFELVLPDNKDIFDMLDTDNNQLVDKSELKYALDMVRKKENSKSNSNQGKEQT